ncbi:hypothetical protein [Streptomyces sp. NPDC001743]|uniref:hypothetical protein n=1 Tax=Streptomyces sp. NPDC001743 TaxID=3154397 RepID=UPI00332C25ED
MTTDDDRLLRLVLIVPVALLTAGTGYFCYLTLTIRPSGPWDDDAYAGIGLAAMLAVAAAGIAMALWLAPSVRRALPWAWTAPAAVMGAAAVVRWWLST